MLARRFFAVPFLLVFLIGGTGQWAEAVIISEFMASNSSNLADEDGDYPDWIEIFNDDGFPVNLAGWSLTDDPAERTKWVFPQVVLGPGQFLVVFASGKDRRDPAGKLHTSFKLSSGGEYVGLVAPGEAVARHAIPDFPAQVSDFSYGFPMQTRSAPVVEPGAALRYHVPLDNSLGSTWSKVDFDAASWIPGTTGIGFDRKAAPTFGDLIQTDVGGVMVSASTSLLLRIPFLLEPADLLKFPELRIQYDDGFAALINGVELVRQNTTGVRYNSRGRTSRTDADALAFERHPLSREALGDSLAPGPNVLGIHLVNRTRTDEDLLCVPVLELVEVTGVEVDGPKYFAMPTPGRPNRDPRSGVAPQPVLSRRGGAFREPVSLELSVPPGTEVRFTLDGSVPTAADDLYEGPILLDRNAVVKARAFQADRLPSPVVTGNFLILRSGFDVDSNLPLFVVSARGGVGGNFTPIEMLVVDRENDGRARITGEPHFMGSGVIKTRGSSTGGRNKASYNFEIRDDRGEDTDVEILGFPEESDFILYGAYNFDRAHVRNAFVYEVSNDVGRYAVRTRFCELYLTRTSGQLSQNDYRGVYTFMEKIKRGEKRVDVEKLLPAHDSEPEISGGYMLKIDRLDPGDRGFSAGGQNMGWVYPKERDVTPAQSIWLRGYFNDFNRALTESQRDPQIAEDPVNGYRGYIDELSWIDHHLINEFTKNPDALRLSTYLFKKRNGKIENGPVWDFDRCLGPDDDPRAQNPVGWMGPRDSSWWGRLLRIPSFSRRYKLRWLELRGNVMTVEHLHGIIDRMAAEIGESAGRDAARWRQVANQAGFDREVQQLKTWVARRVEWMDTQLLVPPSITPAGGHVTPGTQVTVEAPSGEIFYTINGPDPRVGNGSVAAEAIRYTGPIVVDGSTRVRARARISGRTWTPEVEETFFTEFPALVVTEIMYNHPEDRRNLDFIEFKNVGTEPIQLDGLRLNWSRRDRPVFADGDVHTIEPQEILVVVQNREIFTARYGDGVKIAGVLGSSLSDTRQEITLLGPLNERFLVVGYDDDWYPETDGQGHSMVLRDPMPARETWTTAEGWRPSLEVGGSPGRDDVPLVEGLQLAGDINQDRRLNVADAIGMLRHLFQGGVTLPCESPVGNSALLDVNGDASVNLGDPVHVLRFIFQRGPPPAPGLECQPLLGCPSICAE